MNSRSFTLWIILPAAVISVGIVLGIAVSQSGAANEPTNTKVPTEPSLTTSEIKQRLATIYNTENQDIQYLPSLFDVNTWENQNLNALFPDCVFVHGKVHDFLDGGRPLAGVMCHQDFYRLGEVNELLCNARQSLSGSIEDVATLYDFLNRGRYSDRQSTITDVELLETGASTESLYQVNSLERSSECEFSVVTMYTFYNSDNQLQFKEIERHEKSALKISETTESGSQFSQIVDPEILDDLCQVTEVSIPSFPPLGSCYH
ncbi:MAG: hypothetical protein Q8Q20_02835 [bacterium]|nr:hypothetical protein [bacterium]